MGFSDSSFEGQNFGNLEGSVLGDGDPMESAEVKIYGTRQEYTDGVEISFPEVITLGISDGQVLGTTLESSYGFSGEIQEGLICIGSSSGIGYGSDELEESSLGD